MAPLPRSALIDTWLPGLQALAPDRLAAAYASAQPFPHLVLDDVLSPALAASLERACRAAPTPVQSSNGFTQAGKFTLNDWQLMPAVLREVCCRFQSGGFVDWLESVTALAGLIPDPHLEGGGLHRTHTGGFLKLHTDFSWNPRLRLHRRLNVLLFLNSGYQSSWGGQLLLSRHPNRETLAQMTAIEPRFNRLVIFNTNDTTFHGHPAPHAFPSDYPRTSLAFYYYTATPRPWQEQRRLTSTTTRYVPGLRETIGLHGAPLRSRVGYWLRRWTPFG